jgi:hypothetical protein
MSKFKAEKLTKFEGYEPITIKGERLEAITRFMDKHNIEWLTFQTKNRPPIHIRRPNPLEGN